MLSLASRNRPVSMVLRLPALDLDIVAFRDLTPIGVETLLPGPIAPGMRQSLEIVTAGGVIVVADVRAVVCRPEPISPDDWTFAVSWEFVGDVDTDPRIFGLLGAMALETSHEVWH